MVAKSIIIVDKHSHQCPSIRVGQEDVIAVLERIRQSTKALPKCIQVDNGSGFISKALDRGVYEKMTLDFSRRGNPTDKDIIEFFSGSLRDECLNVKGFLALEDAREEIESWRQE